MIFIVLDIGYSGRFACYFLPYSILCYLTDVHGIWHLFTLCWY